MGDLTPTKVTVGRSVEDESDPETVGERVYDKMTDAGEEEKVKDILWPESGLRLACDLWSAGANCRGRRGDDGGGSRSSVSSS